MDIGDCKANGRVAHRRRTWGTMAHKAIRLFRNICSHTRPLDASISMFRPSKRKSGENAAGWGEFCEGWGPKSENGQSRIVNFGISPVESAEIAKIYDISLEKVWRRVCENTYNNYFFLCRCKKKKKRIPLFVSLSFFEITLITSSHRVDRPIVSWTLFDNVRLKES